MIRAGPTMVLSAGSSLSSKFSQSTLSSISNCCSTASTEIACFVPFFVSTRGEGGLRPFVSTRGDGCNPYIK